MEVPLDGTHRPSQCLGQGLHLGPAQTTLVVGVICEGAVGRDRLGGDSGEDEGLDLRDTRKLGLLRHQPPPISGAAVRSGVIECPKAAGPSVKRNSPRRFFYALFTGAYFTYTGILALAPELPLSLAPLLPRVAANRGSLNVLLWRMALEDQVAVCEGSSEARINAADTISKNLLLLVLSYIPCRS